MMKVPDFFSAADPEEALQVQARLAARVRVGPLATTPRYVAGVDAAFLGDKVLAAASLHSYPERDHIEDSVYEGTSTFSYIPGFFAFREGPALIFALEGLKQRPDVILIDGQGIAHPRGIGLASHVGVALDIPTVGCAKTKLFGKFREPGMKKGDWTYLFHPDDGRKIGACVRTRSYVKPVFVSPGHLADFETSVALVLACTAGFRIPEPLRRADRIANALKRER